MKAVMSMEALSLKIRTLKKIERLFLKLRQCKKHKPGPRPGLENWNLCHLNYEGRTIKTEC